jgi:hypothetical protein
MLKHEAGTVIRQIAQRAFQAAAEPGTHRSGRENAGSLGLAPFRHGMRLENVESILRRPF